MKLWVFGDDAWTDDQAVVELVETVQPSVLAVFCGVGGPSGPSETATRALEALWRRCPPLPEAMSRIVCVEASTQLNSLSGMCSTDLAMVFASGPGAMSHLPQDLSDAAVGIIRAKVPLVCIRERPGPLRLRSDPPTRTSLPNDLKVARATLGRLWTAVPELRAAIERAGTAVKDARAMPTWAQVSVAWSEVERLGAEQPRVAPWLWGLEKLLGGWTEKLGR